MEDPEHEIRDPNPEEGRPEQEQVLVQPDGGGEPEAPGLDNPEPNQEDGADEGVDPEDAGIDAELQAGVQAMEAELNAELNATGMPAVAFPWRELITTLVNSQDLMADNLREMKEDRLLRDEETRQKEYVRLSKAAIHQSYNFLQVIDLGEGVLTAVSGGKPDENWNCVEWTKRKHVNQYRDLHMHKNTKVAGRYHPLKPLLAPKQDPTQFCLYFAQQLKDNGFEHFMYIQANDGSSNMINFVENCGILPLEHVIKMSPKLVAEYDAYDHWGDSICRNWLVISGTPELRALVNRVHMKDDVFAVTFHRAMAECLVVTPDMILKRVNLLKSMDVKNFKGQNVEEACAEYRRLAEVVRNAGKYEPSAIIPFMESLSKCLPPDHPKHKLFYPNLQSEFIEPLEKVLEEEFPNDKTGNSLELELVKATELGTSRKGLDMESGLKKAETCFKKLDDGGYWPATSKNDSMKVPKGYGGTNLATVSEVNALIQQQLQSSDKKGGKDGKKGTSGPTIGTEPIGKNVCRNCFNFGHWSGGCTNPKATAAQIAAFKSKYPNIDLSFLKKSDKPKEKNGKGGQGKFKIPPEKLIKEGETKIFNGREHQWCEKCEPSRYSPTHSTATHDPSFKPNKKKTNAGSVNVLIADFEDQAAGPLSLVPHCGVTSSSFCFPLCSTW